jgi:endonuclease-3
MQNISKSSLDSIYKALQSTYGPSVWEPRFSPISELVFTILSQHTSDINSFRAYQNLVDSFDNWNSVAEAEPIHIAETIWMGGLSNVKAPRIKNVLQSIKKLRGDFDISFLKDMPLHQAKKWLCDLPGVGPKTAAVVLCFGLGMPAMPVDTHIYRVSKRLGIIDSNISAEKAHDIMDKQIPPERIFSLHVYLITHGRQICKSRKPQCVRCTLVKICPSAFDA